MYIGTIDSAIGRNTETLVGPRNSEFNRKIHSTPNPPITKVDTYIYFLFIYIYINIRFYILKLKGNEECQPAFEYSDFADETTIVELPDEP